MIKFDLIPGTERKSTGSYYTPPALVQELIKSALEPVLEERLTWAKRVASSEWRVAKEEIQTVLGGAYVHSIISRLRSLAESHRTGRTNILTDQGLSKGGTICSDKPDAQSRDFNSGQHCRGMGTTRDYRISSISENSNGESSGTRDIDNSESADQVGLSRSESRYTVSDRNLKSHASQPTTKSESEIALFWEKSPLTTRYSLLASEAILGLRICDPACGSGHFLLAAARRLGLELARVRTGEEHPSVDEVSHATREVIQHCLYGVDKNPLAVDLCKVALWLEGACRGEPLTFLDHRIKCGDSLVGVFDLKVLEEGIPDEAFKALPGDDKAVVRELKKENKAGRKLFAPIFQIEKKLEELSRKFRELEELPDQTLEDLEAKKKLYREIVESPESWVLEQACNLWTAAFFMPKTEETKPFVPTSEKLFRYLQHPKAADGRLIGQVGALAQKLRFFHWPLEFPEVFYRRSPNNSQLATPRSPNNSPLATRHSPNVGFDVVLGNPPFMGGKKISRRLGKRYRGWLEITFKPWENTADLCAAFLRRAFNIIRPGGRLGMVATNTISQGDTRESGLAEILKQDGIITYAKRFVKWPGAANVEVNLVGIYKAQPFTTRSLATSLSPILDGEPVPFISSRLDDEPEAEPKRLPQNEEKAFIGDYVRGIGFILEQEEAEALLAKDPQNADCLFPYLNGKDLNSHPEQKPSRWVICFHDWDLERARQYPDLLHIVEERVKPERQKLRGSGDRHSREYWWQFHNYRKEFRRAITPLRRVLVRATVSDTHAMVFIPKGWVYNHKTIVFAFDDDYHFALLQCNVHEAWMRRFTSTMRTDVNYSPTDCFETFPFPPEEYKRMASNEWQLENLPTLFKEAARIGEEYHEYRRQIMLKRWIGLTKTYKLFHDPNCTDPDIQRLRELHAEMDRAILACYGWDDIDPRHDFYPNDRGQIRFTISPEARREILHRLLELNLELAENETYDDILE